MYVSMLTIVIYLIYFTGYIKTLLPQGCGWGV